MLSHSTILLDLKLGVLVFVLMQFDFLWVLLSPKARKRATLLLRSLVKPGKDYDP